MLAFAIQQIETTLLQVNVSSISLEDLLQEAWEQLKAQQPPDELLLAGIVNSISSVVNLLDSKLL